MSSIRERIRMTDEEIAGLLAAPLKLQLATINADGTPHLVTMYYALVDDRIAFWTYRTSQKAVNLARDPRLTCLVEEGDAYDQLRGVQIGGRVETVEGYEATRAIGAEIYGRYHELTPAMLSYIDDQAKKRNAYLVVAERVASWDHCKLAAAYAAG